MRPEVTRIGFRDLWAPAGVFPGVASSDGDLVDRARGGDLEAFAVLVGRHRDRLLRYATHMLGSAEDAEEVVQDALVRAFRSLASCEPGRFSAWLYRILVNRCRTAARRRRWWWTRVADLDRASEVGAPDAGVGIGWREEIERALRVLPAEQREAFLLKHVDELSYEEMSGITGASVPALKMRVSRACERLRDQLAVAR